MARRKSDAHVDKKAKTENSRFDSVISAVAEMELAQDFLELPDREEIPDYYEIVTNPISLNEIRENHYESAVDLIADFQLMADNANTYNDPQSEIAQDAIQILEFVKEQLKEKPLPKIKIRPPNSFQQPPAGTTQKQKYLNVLDELVDYEVDGVRIGEPFLHEVSRKDYPDYYKVIKKAMSLGTVKDNLTAGRIKSMGQFINQVELVFKNAQTYNDEGSLLYQDSRVLQDHFRQRMELVKRDIEEQQRVQQEQQLALKKTSTPPVKLKIKQPVKLNLTPVVGPEEEFQPLQPQSDHSEDEEDDSQEIEKPVDLPSTRERTRIPSQDSFIQEITISSSRSLYKQVVRPMNQAPLQVTQSWFEHTLKASEFYVDSYTLTLNRHQGAVSMSALLNESLMKKRYQAFLTVNGERVNPVPSIHYAESGKLTSRYELKLPLGLSMVVFDVIVDNNDEQRRAVEDREKKTLWVQVL
jgi:chromatin structure-remodeling complex subunit RSC4